MVDSPPKTTLTGENYKQKNLQSLEISGSYPKDTTNGETFIQENTLNLSKNSDGLWLHLSHRLLPPSLLAMYCGN